MIYILVLLGAIVLWLIATYNRLITLRMRTKEALSDIDVQSKRRYDLIPNLVETVKGYAAHEKGVFESVTAARSRAMATGGTPLDRAGAENALSGTLKTLFAVAENYPVLKADQNFLELQRELSDTENKMQAARRFYNATASDLNTNVARFPTNLIAGMFGFTAEKFFEVSKAEEREAVKVQF